MLLQSVQIENFRCIGNSNSFRIDENVTCLVGKNESGKTTILQALNKLNSSDPATGIFNGESDYPRQEWSEYKDQAATHPANILKTVWRLEEDDLNAINSFLDSEINAPETVTIFKGYDNKVSCDFAFDEQMLVQKLIEKSTLLEDEKRGLEASDVITLLKKLQTLQDPTQRQKEFLASINTKFAGMTAVQKISESLQKRIPKFAYFSEYLRMPGQLSLVDLKSRISNPNQLKDGDKVFLALLELIGRTVDQLEQTNRFESLIAELEAASNRLTKEIFQFWTQNRNLKVQFRFEHALPGDQPPFNSGYILRTRIENLRHGVSTSFDQRSAGFVWFFSFLVWFAQVKKNYGNNLILLLDERGLSLHAKAQADLLRYIETRLAPNYQVIYTTHSPFMIDPAHLLRARTVEDKYVQPKEGEPLPANNDLGTKVGDDVLSTDADTIFPLQACLGYEISQTLFAGPHSLLVEGPSDLLYLQWFKRKLASLDRISLDERWTITPCGGVDKVAAFLSLFGAKGIHVAVFTDLCSGQKRKVRDLGEKQLLKAGHILTANSYTSKPEADIEDLLGDQTFQELVNRCYDLSQKLALPSDNTRILKRVEDYFRVLPPETEEFDHFRPAEFLTIAGLDIPLPEIESALERFERLFKDLNALLPVQESKRQGNRNNALASLNS